MGMLRQPLHRNQNSLRKHPLNVKNATKKLSAIRGWTNTIQIHMVRKMMNLHPDQKSKTLIVRPKLELGETDNSVTGGIIMEAAIFR